MNGFTPATDTGHAARWIALAVLVVPVLLTSMDLSVLYLAIPAISADLAPTSSQMLWILDIYGFVLAGLLITMGSLGDRFGRRLILLIGAIVFGAASVLAAFSTSPEMLIAARALMGLGGATLMPSTLSLIRNMFDDPDERAKAVGIWTAAFAGGGALGPVVGGALLNFFGWGTVFLINVPVIIVLLIAAPILVPEHRDSSGARLDLPGAALSMVAVLPLVYAIKHAVEITGWDTRASIALGVGLLGAALFVLRLRTAPHPLIDMSLLHSRRFLGALVAITLGIMALLGPNMFLAQYLQLVAGLSPLFAALWMVPMTIAAMAGSILAPQLRRKTGTAAAIAIGFTTASIGLVVIALTPPENGGTIIVAGGVVLAAGVTTVMTLATDTIIASATPDKAGATSAIQETGSEFGGALGIAFMGSLGAAVYRSEIDSAGDFPAAARESLAGAVEAASALPDHLGDQLLSAARDAFTSGLSVAAIVAALAMAALAVVVPWLIRGTDNEITPVTADGERTSKEKDRIATTSVPTREEEHA